MKVGVGKIQLNCQLSGREGAPFVVLSHALASSMIMWQLQLGVLEDHFRVLRYDMRGHGGSDVPAGPYTLEMLCGDVVDLLDVLRIEQAHFVGLSIGGMIGQGLALDYSSRFASVTLCDTTSITPDEMKAGLKERIETIKKYGMKSQVHTTMKRWFTKRFLGAANPEKEMIRNQILATPTEGTIGCLEAIHNLNYQDRLAQVRLPALILVGENDATTPVAASQAIHERVPDSRMITIPSAGHLANIEQAAVFNKEILRFLLGF